MEVDRLIREIVVKHEGAEYSYEHVCAKWAGHCRSVLLDLSDALWFKSLLSIKKRLSLI